MIYSFGWSQVEPNRETAVERYVSSNQRSNKALKHTSHVQTSPKLISEIEL